ncbi:MAG: hypothetical protein KJ970_04675 [Candidatus Eisenbacteria bacterium]|uniref:Uncharacterized protein n=1 Tax=Eiseniibacteriota bacterium TaxID=2212470 RepID=A0A948RTC9_UNCEI|nr:hypothetical protein [Candidatus Eisenbacteria bacterium]
MAQSGWARLQIQKPMPAAPTASLCHMMQKGDRLDSGNPEIEQDTLEDDLLAHDTFAIVLSITISFSV